MNPLSKFTDLHRNVNSQGGVYIQHHASFDIFLKSVRLEREVVVSDRESWKGVKA